MLKRGEGKGGRRKGEGGRSEGEEEGEGGRSEGEGERRGRVEGGGAKLITSIACSTVAWHMSHAHHNLSRPPQVMLKAWKRLLCSEKC
jgi:hypothetical protein